VSLKVTYKRGDSREAMLSVSVATDTTVGDVAKQLFQMDSSRTGIEPFSDATLVVTPLSAGADVAPRAVDAEAPFESSGIRSGDHVEVVSGAAAQTSAAAAAAVAVVNVVSGADAGKSFSLYPGSNVIGRDADVAVKLTDSLASKRHARIIVGDDLEIIDMGSTNGVMIGDTYVTRAQLLPGDTIVIGDTEMEVTRESRTQADVPTTSSIAFTRSPRVVGPLPDDKVDIPSPPTQPQNRPFPRLALVAPVVLGITMYLVTGRLFTLIFVAMSPMLMLGSYFDQKSQNKRKLAQKRIEFDASIANTETTIAGLQEQERAARNQQSPSTAEILDSAELRGSLLWTRRPEHDGFLTARVGLGTIPTSLEITLPPANDTFPELWEKALAIHEQFGTISNAPVTIDLRSAGGAGIAGDLVQARAVARSVLVQILGLHSPMECVVTGFVSAATANEWRWLEWMPHVTSPLSPLSGDHVTQTRKSAQALLVQLEALVESRSGRDIGNLVPTPRGTSVNAVAHDEEPPELPAVVVVVEDDAPADRSRLIRLAEKGADVNVHVLWIAPAVASIPAACRSYIDVGPEGSGPVGHVRAGATVHPVTYEAIDVATAARFARRTSCVEDISVIASDSGAIPGAVSYLDLHGFEAIEPGHHEQRWRADAVAAGSTRRNFTLRALVGHTGDEPLYLDLRSQGPHALVGGTTGAGKSEFLQSWILGMAAAYSPERVTFLFVDYKGGSAFADCVKLPHSVGLVTDLTPALVDRALASLRAELHYRERLLAAKGAKDLETLEKSGDADSPPSLVIVIDEFAALVNEVPAFVDGVVDIAQRGRSLGLHLIMATQRPAGVIKDNLRANTNLRIALRMADEADSSDILGISAAAHVDASLPGRAMARTGPGRIATFQSAYAGAHSVPGATGGPRLKVSELALGSGGPWELPSSGVQAAPDGESDAARVVSAMAVAAELLELPAPRRPWLDELATTYELRDLAKQAGGPVAFGLVDDPAHQAQYVAQYDPDQDGNLVILGGSGAGKSCALRTIALGATLSRDIAPVHIYAVDASSGGLEMLQVLPNVAGVLDSDDVERVGRTMKRLVALVRERLATFGEARASTLTEYRAKSKERGIPRVFLLVDGYGLFQTEYMHEAGRAPIFQDFQEILTAGRAAGVHVVMSADRVGALHTTIQALVSRTVVLRLSDENQYGMIGLRKGALAPDSPSGRAVDLASKKELQIAVLGGSERIDEQARAIEKLALKVPDRPEWKAEAIPRMPAQVLGSEMPDSVDGLPVLGMESESLAPRGFDMERPIIIVGQAGTGRTAAMAWLASAIRRANPDARIVHLSQRRSALGDLKAWTASHVGPAAAEEFVAKWGKALEAPGEGKDQLVVCIESVQDFGASMSDGPIVQAIKTGRRNGHLIIGEAETQGWSSGQLVSELKSARRGLLLAPEGADAQMLFSVQAPRMARADMPPGRGVWIESGRVAVIQVPWLDGEFSPL